MKNSLAWFVNNYLKKVLHSLLILINKLQQIQEVS